MTPDLRVVVMAKSPRAGQSKTRLVPALGAEGAARLAARMLRHALDQATAAAVGAVELCAAPDTEDALLCSAAARVGARLVAQGDGDLGARLARAAERSLREAGAVLILGTDAPALDAALIRRAAAALEGHPAVLVPAIDGGYALIGLRGAPGAQDAWPARVFEGIAWSTAAVLDQTRAAFAAAGVQHVELEPVHDIDEPGDLSHVPKDWWREIDITAR